MSAAISAPQIACACWIFSLNQSDLIRCLKCSASEQICQVFSLCLWMGWPELCLTRSWVLTTLRSVKRSNLIRRREWKSDRLQSEDWQVWEEPDENDMPKVEDWYGCGKLHSTCCVFGIHLDPLHCGKVQCSFARVVRWFWVARSYVDGLKQ